MPTISWFYGIAIRMYVVDHNPPHFHVIYNEYAAMISISNGELIEGSLPKRARRLVADWMELHHAELVANWALASEGNQPERIAGLDADQGD